MKFRVVQTGLMAWMWCANGLMAQGPLAEARTAMEKWVETRQLISREHQDWTEEQDLIRRSIEMFDSELKRLETEIQAASTSHSQVEKERMDLEAQNQEYLKAHDDLKPMVIELEKELRALVPLLPAPLTDKLKPLFSRLPEDSTQTTLSHSQRMQIVIGILNEIEKFNGSFSVFSEIQKHPEGKDIQVKTLYLGLGQAFFVDPSGSYAGTGEPGPEGWSWTSRLELAQPVQKAIAVFESAQPAAFVSLPVSIQ